MNKYKNDENTLIFYEAPHKLKDTLSAMQKVFGGERKLALAREMTKIHEQVLRMTADEAVSYYNENDPRGEYVLVVEGACNLLTAEHSWWEDMTVCEHIDKYIADGMDSKEAVKAAAKDRNIPKREAYNEYHGR